MKAVIYNELGRPDIPRYEDVPDGICSPQSVLSYVTGFVVTVDGGLTA